MLSFIKEDSIIKAYNLNTTKLEPQDREKSGLLKIEKDKIYFHLDEKRYLELEIIGKAKEKEIKNAFCSNAFLVAQVLNLSKNQERQVLELKCYFFKRPIKTLREALNINFKDTIVEKLLKDMRKDEKLENFKETCILKMAGLTYFVCVLPYEDENKENKENKENSEEILEEDFRLLNTKGELSVKHALINNRHSYEAISLRPIKQELVPGLCLFFQGSLEFNDKTTKTMQTRLLVQIQQDEKSYLKIWEKYLIKSAQKSFNEAKEVGVLKIESVEKEGGNLKIRFKPALDKNKMEILKKKSQLKEGSDLGVLEDLDTQNEESLINFISKPNKQTSPNNSEPKETITIKDISGDDFIIKYNHSIKEGETFYLNYMGDLNTLIKQYSALDKTKKGLSANPNLGLILNIKENKEDSDGDNDAADTMDKFLKEEILSSYKTKALGLTKRVKEKVFKNGPTENQEKAVKIALNTPDIAIIQGPPGTGKTTVINAICERLFEEYPKDKNIKGQILLCAQGHDATNNVCERIKVGGLPTFKFGYRNTEEQYKQNERLYEQLREFAEIFIESVREKLQKLGDYENTEKILDLEEALRRYYSSPISELEFLKEIEKNAIFLNSSMREKLSQLKAGQQKQEMPANLSVIHALRTTQEGFEDDGVMRNYDLLESQFKENLTKEDRELLESFEPNLEKLQELKIRLLEKLSSQSPNDKRIRVLLEYLSVLERNPWDLESLLKDYNFVFSSTIGKYHEALEEKETPYFDSVIVDEAAKANPLELLMVMALAKERIILVGDDRQLPHYLDDEIEKKLEDESQDVKDEIEKALKDSMFKKLKERAQKLKELDGKESFITLNKQYRMHLLLGGLVSDVFYEPHNEGFESPLKKEHFKHNLRNLDSKPLAWIDVKNTKERRNADGSYYRESEIAAIKKCLDDFMEDEPNFTFGVITFFSEQKRRLEQALKGYANLEIGTVDSFQGKEFDVVFLSSVRTSHTEGFGFLKDSPRLCVALSRQKRALIVVGDREKFETQEAKDKVSGLFEFLQLCKKEGKILVFTEEGGKIS
ncbi:AAA domain-containing protein [Helicobacter pylori]